MTVYVLCVDDRHADPGIEVWSTFEKAKERAEYWAGYLCRGFEPEVHSPVGEWLYYTSWCAGDSRAWVVKEEVDGHKPEEGG